jgi:hypothetical protein
MYKSILSEDEIFMQKITDYNSKINEAYYFTAGYNRSYEILIESLSEITISQIFQKRQRNSLFFKR